MAAFTLTIADADVPRVISALCDNFGYAEISADNAMAGVITYITQVVANVETTAARKAALASIPPIPEITVFSGTPVSPVTPATPTPIAAAPTKAVSL